MKPFAPARLSITTGCLVCAVISWPSARASWSVALPAANGTTNVIGFSGYSAARNVAVQHKATEAHVTATRRATICEHDSIGFITPPETSARAQWVRTRGHFGFRLVVPAAPAVAQ